MNFSDSSLNTKFLLNKDIEFIGFAFLKSKTINDIEVIGFDTYNEYLSLLCLTSDDIYDLLDMNDDFQNVEPFDFILSNCLINEDFLKQITSALSFFLGEQVYFSKDSYFYINEINEGRFLHIANFNFFIDILKRQNCISENLSNKRRKPKNEAEKNLYRQLNKARAKYSKKDNSDMSEIISSVCAKHPSINLFNVGDLTIYQLIDQYKRLNAIDEYFISIDSLLHGASSEDVKVVHWSSKQKT
jgi:hypothetical protein